VVVFPLIYFALVPRFLPGPPLVKGLVFGFVLWLLAATVVMPMAGAGFFMSEIGGIKAAIAALLGHLVYGGLLGTITNEDRNWNLKPALHQHYNGVNPLEEGLNK
jgi:uncharacterized membrane protein YagU involved in acid resistance